MTNDTTGKDERTVDTLRVKIYGGRADMGSAAAHTVAEWMRKTIADKGTVNVIFGAAPSQNEFLSTLGAIDDLDWSRVVAMHMDEYINLPADAPQGFGNFLDGQLWNRVQPGQVHTLDSTISDPQAECERYTNLLKSHPVDIVCGGIGENGHLAFNDPGVADFHDPLLVKVVELDRQCRQQQVNDGCFATIEDVPTHAMTLTIPALMEASRFCCVVPGSTKARAVQATLNDPISEACPATILRRHSGAILFLERESAALL